jgi:hypothetical protein
MIFIPSPATPTDVASLQNCSEYRRLRQSSDCDFAAMRPAEHAAMLPIKIKDGADGRRLRMRHRQFGDF